MMATTQQLQESLRSLNRDGERQFAAGDLDAARQLFERALELKGDDATTLNNLAVCYWTQGELLQALCSVSLGLENAPDSVELAINGGSILESCGCADLARRLYHTFLDQSPDAMQVRERLDAITAQGHSSTIGVGDSDPDQLNRYGEERFGRGDLAAAEGAFRRCIELDPQHVEAVNNLGVLLWQQGDAAQSLQVFARGLAIQPNNPALVANGGQVLAASGHASEAKRLYESYLKDYPGDQTIQAHLQSVSDVGIPEAVPGSSQSAMVRPESDPIGQPQFASAAELNRQGESLYQSGDAAGATRMFERALQLDPSDVEALNNLGTLSWSAGEGGRALDYFRRALEIDVDHRPSLVNCAVVLEGLGYPEDARQLRRRAS